MAWLRVSWVSWASLGASMGTLTLAILAFFSSRLRLRSSLVSPSLSRSVLCLDDLCRLLSLESLLSSLLTLLLRDLGLVDLWWLLRCLSSPRSRDLDLDLSLRLAGERERERCLSRSRWVSLSLSSLSLCERDEVDGRGERSRWEDRCESRSRSERCRSERSRSSRDLCDEECRSVEGERGMVNGCGLCV